MTKLSANLAEAWMQRQSAAAVELLAAQAAPALFKPERVAQVGVDYQRARAWSGYWTGVGS